MAGSVEEFERSVVFRMGRGIGLVASVCGVLMVVVGVVVVTKTAGVYMTAQQPPSVPLEDVRALIEPDPSPSSSAVPGSEQATLQVPGCAPATIASLASAVVGDMTDSSTSPVEKAAARNVVDDESAAARGRGALNARITRLVTTRCEDVDEAYRSAFLAEAETVLGAAPKGKKAVYWDAYTKAFDRRAARAAALRTSAGTTTLTGTILAATLTIGGFVIVALFGALLALLALERTARKALSSSGARA